MSASEGRLLKIMAYADGELEGAERLEIEALVESDVEAARVLGEMRSLGDLVRLGYEAETAPKVSSVDLTGAIMDAVAEEKIEEKPAKVLSLDGARKHRKKIGAAVVAALALAASVFVATRQKTEMPIAQGPESPSIPMNAAVSGGVGVGVGVEVEAVESPGQSVSVFYLPTGNELSTSVVVWVDETGEK